MGVLLCFEGTLYAMWYDAPVTFWENVKSSILPNDGYLRALVHVHGAMTVYLLLAFLARRGFSAFWPVGVVCALTLANETIDLLDLPDLSQIWVWRDTAGDILNSVVWPLGIMITARLLQRKAHRSVQVV